MCNLSTFFYNLKQYFKNLKRFQTILWTYRDFDYSYIIDIVIFCLQNLKNALVHEIDGPREKKQKKIDELCKLLQDFLSETGIFDSTWDSEKETAKEYCERINKQYAEGFDKIYSIIKGTEHTSEEDYDGSGILNWWD